MCFVKCTPVMCVAKCANGVFVAEVVTLFVGRLNNDTTAEAVKKLFKKNGIKCKDVRKMDKKR